jgi:hypothetical protein
LPHQISLSAHPAPRRAVGPVQLATVASLLAAIASEVDDSVHDLLHVVQMVLELARLTLLIRVGNQEVVVEELGVDRDPDRSCCRGARVDMSAVHDNQIEQQARQGVFVSFPRNLRHC